MPTKRPPAGFLVLADAVTKFGVAQRVIERLIREEKVKVWRADGNPIYVSEADLTTWQGTDEWRDLRAETAHTGEQKRGAKPTGESEA
jgi:hypothetical protein